MPELFRIRIPLQFPPDKKDFVEQIQNACFDHCLEITKIFREALNHGQEAFSDTWICVVAHDSIRVIAHYLQKSLGSVARHSDSVFRSMVMSGLSANVQALARMTSLQALAKPLVRLLCFPILIVTLTDLRHDSTRRLSHASKLLA